MMLHAAINTLFSFHTMLTLVVTSYCHFALHHVATTKGNKLKVLAPRQQVAQAFTGPISRCPLALFVYPATNSSAPTPGGIVYCHHAWELCPFPSA